MKTKAPEGVHIEAAVRVHRPAEICYRYWRDFKNLPNFMSHVVSVKVLDPRRSHWVVSAPADTTAEWDAEIVEDVENEKISWRAFDKAEPANEGVVQFFRETEGGRQTHVSVSITYYPPMGFIGEVLTGLFGERPLDQLTDDLTRFKQAAEKKA